MKILFLILSVLFYSSCSSVNHDDVLADDTKGCALLYDLKREKYLRISGGNCDERFPPFSTFKIPLAVMAFDSGLLKDEHQVLKWDGVINSRPVANQDHNAEGWMRNSIVWFSQKITPLLGVKRIRKYLESFKYGNSNIDAGLTDAWLKRPGSGQPSLELSSFEQMEFMKKLWSDKLPVSERSMKLTRKIMFLETSPQGFQLSGKTGSGHYDNEKRYQLGWFVAHVTNGKEHYLTVVTLSDTKPYRGELSGGERAKEITKKILRKESLW